MTDFHVLTAETLMGVAEMRWNAANKAAEAALGDYESARRIYTSARRDFTAAQRSVPRNEQPALSAQG